MVEENEKVLLAVSGGVDSMVMLELFRASEIQFAVAHCNFGLRGEDSAGDEALVSERCKRHGIDFYVKHIKIEAGSIQLEAREKRYLWFEELMAKEKYAKLATAHHLDDSLETTLLNLARGTSYRGLKGVPLKNGPVIRPLLFASKEQLLDFAEEKELKWREDISNHKTDYDRNKIRLAVTPKLLEINSSLIATYRDTKERLTLLADYIDAEVEAVLKEHFNTRTGELDLKWIKGPKELILLNEILSAYEFNYKTVKEVYRAIGKSGKQFPTTKYQIVMDRTSLFILKHKADATAMDLVIEGEGNYVINGKMFLVTKIPQVNDFDQGSRVALFNLRKVSLPIKVRRWKEGDTFTPLGMKGRKKVSDFLIDQKVPLSLKEDVLVLEVAGEIAWVVGYRISDHFKLGKHEEVLRIEVT